MLIIPGKILTLFVQVEVVIRNYEDSKVTELLNTKRILFDLTFNPYIV